MLKALFKKQWLEMNTWFFQNKKTGKHRSTAGMIGFGIFYFLAFGVVAALFVILGHFLCESLISSDMAWFYHAITCMVAVAMGAFGSVFNTFATLYQAKDNELLLAMPIPPSKILTVRLFSVWFWGLVYEALVLLPTMIMYWITSKPNVWIILGDLWLIFILSFFVLIISCILGWVVAKISSKLKHKSLITVFASLLFLGGYYYIYFKASSIIQNLLMNALIFGQKVKDAFYPLFVLGKAGEGDGVSLLIVTAFILLLLVLTWIIMSRTFLKMATIKSGAAKKAYKEKTAKFRSVSGALFYKEFRRYLSSSAYMLNCSLGILFLVIAGGALLIKGEFLMTFMPLLPPFIKDKIPLFICAIICSIVSMNDLTAPSISLEGKHIWLTQVLPVSGWQVLKAKMQLHLILTWIPTLFCGVCVLVVLKPEPLSAVMILLLPLLFAAFHAAWGLVLNLKAPNLTWTNETAPVKQGLAVTLALFSGWILIAAMGGIYYLLRNHIPADIYLLICSGVTFLLTVVCLLWLRKRGTRIFETL